MGTLKHDWLTDYLIDFEYKKYVLLGYMQRVKKQFEALNLFPELSDLIFHYRNLMHYIESKEMMDDNLPVEMSGIDIKAMRLMYEKISKDDQLMTIINDIVTFAMPQFEDAIYEGREVYEVIEDHIKMETVGVLPLYTKEGYFILTADKEQEAVIYKYDLSSIERPDETFRTITSTLIKKVKLSPFETLTGIKSELTSEHKELPVPAIYRFNSALSIPHTETFLPITKRILLKELLAAA